MYLGDFPYGATVYVPFNTYDANGASVTLTGLAATDIEVYKNGSATQRGSDNGYALLDTDGIDFDGITGIHGFSIDTSDNSTAGFFGPGNDYFVVVASVTVDTRTINFVMSFSIENRHTSKLLLRTTIASLASQTSFTLTAGSTDDDAYNGCEILIQDVGSTVQKAIGVVLDYAGSTKTVTLLADPAVFTMATTDYVSIYADRSLKPTVNNRTLDVSAGGEAGVDWANVGTPGTTLNLSGTTISTVTTLTGHTPQTGDSFARIGATGSGLSTLAQTEDLEAVGGMAAAIKLKTDLIPGTIDGKTFSELVTLFAAVLLGKASGLAGITAVYRAVDDSKDRVTASVTADGESEPPSR